MLNSFHEGTSIDIPSSFTTTKGPKNLGKAEKLSNRVLDLESLWGLLWTKEIAILKDEKRSLDKEVASNQGGFERIASGYSAAEVVNAGVAVSTAELKTPPTTITTLLEDDEDKEEGKAPLITTDLEVEHAEQIHLDHLLAQRMQEEQEMTKQQKKRQAEVLESAKYYTEEDWDIIRANVESNTELSKILLGENKPVEDFATRMVNLLNQRNKFFAEQRKLRTGKQA
ncbi:hypothetical protein Tco_0407462 [Tanacetum coccineum]